MSQHRLRPVAIATDLGEMTTLGESHGEHLAVTPTIIRGRLFGYFSVVHIPTGNIIPGTTYLCIACARAAAKRLHALDFDWARRDWGRLSDEDEDLIARAAISACIVIPCRPGGPA